MDTERLKIDPGPHAAPVARPSPDNIPKPVEVDPDNAVESLVLNLPYAQQTQSNWCWAACISMLRYYYSGMAIDQCEFVTQVYGQTGGSICPVEGHGCCNPAYAANCDIPIPIVDYVQVCNQAGMPVMHEGLMTFPRLQAAIRANQAVIVFVEHPTQAAVGHLFVIDGFCTDDVNPAVVHVLDPDPNIGPSWYVFADLLLNYYWHGSRWRFSFVANWH